MSDKRFITAVSWTRGLAYATTAVLAGVVVGELAAMVIFSGSIDRLLDEAAARSADPHPPSRGSAELEHARQARTLSTTRWIRQRGARRSARRRPL